MKLFKGTGSQQTEGRKELKLVGPVGGGMEGEEERGEVCGRAVPSCFFFSSIDSHIPPFIGAVRTMQRDDL